MENKIQPLVPVNTEGLDDIAEALLVQSSGSQGTGSQNPSSINDAQNYIILPTKTHGSYAYPDLLVDVHRLGLNSSSQKEAQRLNLQVSNVAKEADGTIYIGNFNQEEALKLVSGLNVSTFTIREYADFLDMIRKGINGQTVYDGKGKPIVKNKLQAIYDEIMQVREPWRSEHFDAAFPSKKKISYSRFMPDGSLSKVTEDLEDCLMKDGWIFIEDWLKNANRQGLPLPTVAVNNEATDKTKQIYYGYPRKGTVARFDAISGRADLGCDRYPDYRSDALGVRVVRKKI